MLKNKNEAKKIAIRSNRILDVLENLGFQDMKPTDQLLQDLGISRKRFFQILRNENEMQVGESEAFFIWLEKMGGVEIELDLFKESVEMKAIKNDFKMEAHD